MPLIYGFRDGDKEENNERYDALTEEEQQIYHNVLPFAMMLVHISRITPNTIKPFRARLHFRGFEKEHTLLSEEFLNKVLGYSANVDHHASTRDWLMAISRPTGGHYRDMTVFYEETDWKHPYEGEDEEFSQTETETFAHIPLPAPGEWENYILEKLGEKQPKTPEESLYIWMLDMLEQGMSKKQIIASLGYYIGTKESVHYGSEIIKQKDPGSIRL